MGGTYSKCGINNYRCEKTYRQHNKKCTRIIDGPARTGCRVTGIFPLHIERSEYLYGRTGTIPSDLGKSAGSGSSFRKKRTYSDQRTAQKITSCEPAETQHLYPGRHYSLCFLCFDYRRQHTGILYLYIHANNSLAANPYGLGLPDRTDQRAAYHLLQGFRYHNTAEGNGRYRYESFPGRR